MSIIIFAKCQECDYHSEVFHLDWYQIMCRNCDAEIENDYVVEEGHQISGASSEELESITIPKYISDQLLEVLDPIYFKDTIITMIHNQLDDVIKREKGRLECK